MKKYWLATTLGLLLGWPALASAKVEDKPLPKDLPPFGEDRPLPVPKIETLKTPEGLTVWLVKRPAFPKLSAQLVVRGGSAADPDGAEGISELLAQTMKEGTAKRSSRQIAEELQAVGGEISASSQSDAIMLAASCLKSGAERMIDIVADVARRPSFPPKEVELAKGNALQGLQVRESTPEFLGQKGYAKAIFGDHPYHVVAPSAEVITAATPETLKREHARRFRPEAALLVVVGDFDVALMSKAVTRAFAGWKGTGEAPPPTPPAPAAGARRIHLVDRPGSVQSQIIVGRIAVNEASPDYFPLFVGNTIFGGSFGSRLTHNIREDKGYTYSPGASVQTFEKGGLLRVRADVRNEVTAPTLLEIFYEMDRMAATPVSAEELSRGKRYQCGIYLLRNQINDAVAGTLAANWVRGLKPEALGEFVPKVNAVTAEEIRRAARNFYPSLTQTVVVVGDAAKVRDELSQYGKVEDLKP